MKRTPKRLEELNNIPRGKNGRPLICTYCDGKGNSTAGGECGFCDGGKPLDTQEDWDRTWGHTFEVMSDPDWAKDFIERHA